MRFRAAFPAPSFFGQVAKITQIRSRIGNIPPRQVALTPSRVSRERPPGRRVGAPMFLFFSNRAGCFGSLLLTALGSLILLYVMGFLG